MGKKKTGGMQGAWFWGLLAVAAGSVGPAQAFSSAAHDAAILPRRVPNGAVSWGPQSLQLRLHVASNARRKNVRLHAVSMAAQGRGPKQGQKGR